MSWGTKVIIILAVFVIGILSMVYISMQQTNEMVDDNYYEQELKYQGVIDGKNNLHQLTDTVALLSNDQYLQIQLPSVSVSQLDSGNIHFLKLSNSKEDRNIEMKKENGALYKIPASWLSKGWYKVKMQWSNNGTKYYHEQNFNVQ